MASASLGRTFRLLSRPNLYPDSKESLTSRILLRSWWTTVQSRWKVSRSFQWICCRCGVHLVLLQLHRLDRHKKDMEGVPVWILKPSLGEFKKQFCFATSFGSKTIGLFGLSHISLNSSPLFNHSLTTIVLLLVCLFYPANLFMSPTTSILPLSRLSRSCQPINDGIGLCVSENLSRLSTLCFFLLCRKSFV